MTILLFLRQPDTLERISRTVWRNTHLVILVNHILIGAATAMGNPKFHRKPAERSDVIHGLAGSPGAVEGIARLVRSVDEFGEVRDGEILVCQMTNPAWVVLFTRIGGLVTDAGGVASHPAVVAREFGLPAVVGTSVATDDDQSFTTASGKSRLLTMSVTDASGEGYQFTFMGGDKTGTFFAGAPIQLSMQMVRLPPDKAPKPATPAKAKPEKPATENPAAGAKK